MKIVRPRPFGQKYAFVVVGVVFLALLVSAGQRSAPGVLIRPLEEAFGWSRETVSLSAAIGIFLYGMVGPFAATLMVSLGIRRVVLGALVLMTAATGLSYFMAEAWQLILTWGVFSGLGSGCIAIVLGATVVNRWFATNRGLMMGLLTASAATGTLLFLPALAALADAFGWPSVVLTVAAASALMIPLVWWLLPESPAAIGQLPYGAAEAPAAAPPRAGNMIVATFATLGRGMRTKAFWYLFATFFICGFTTNGLVGTHLIALCGDQGIPEVQAAGLLAAMGLFDLIGTTLSGWLTDRFDPRKLLFVYYGIRGLSLIFLIHSDFDLFSLALFSIFFGLDWIATVPPTARLANEHFGDRDAPVLFGWIAAGHQMGAASAAFFAGYMRTVQGNYLDAFVIAGATGLVAALLSVMMARRPAQRPA
ncbi:MFS transporter [Zavarzinia compransoris]|uniref:MFS transporter n=1 Tax=Zavarzinia compransoris TaxID=1264899 RepID=A0A317E785_9PROT|nr:MFS transporter [Zavarzinia compransoris]PWR22140.1 MFS transporter [Zavarzinia compransoris]TDP47109.1 putative MFS family arabinose efflux permease [Zavarzinia compransoris]